MNWDRSPFITSFTLLLARCKIASAFRHYYFHRLYIPILVFSSSFVIPYICDIAKMWHQQCTDWSEWNSRFLEFAVVVSVFFWLINKKMFTSPLFACFNTPIWLAQHGTKKTLNNCAADMWKTNFITVKTQTNQQTE